MEREKRAITHWLEHPKARVVCAIEYEITQGYRESTKENWKEVDDLRHKIDMDIKRGKKFKISHINNQLV